AERPVAGDAHRFASHAIRDRAERERSEHHPEGPARDAGAEHDARNVQLGAQRRGHETHDLGIESVDEHDRGAQAGDEDVRAPEGVRVDGRAGVGSRNVRQRVRNIPSLREPTLRRRRYSDLMRRRWLFALALVAAFATPRELHAQGGSIGTRISVTPSTRPGGPRRASAPRQPVPPIRRPVGTITTVSAIPGRYAHRMYVLRSPVLGVLPFDPY